MTPHFASQVGNKLNKQRRIQTEELKMKILLLPNGNEHARLSIFFFFFLFGVN